jgi:lipopolysaccharide export system protein LptA
MFRNIFMAFLVVMTGFSVMSRAQRPQAGGNSEKDERDSLVFLLSSKSAQTVVIDGISYRKVVGPARFLHNGTYLLCDTALWNVDNKVIDAWGNVSILQDETVLTSDNLKYLVDQDLAQFRGSVVQLTDKDHNTLRTRHLDYNTADSVAVFQNGGAMRDKDGQIIESRNGTYDSKIKVFTFENDVNMFTDSIFVKTRSLVYESDKDLATFGFATDVWKDDNMLSSNKGWYDRANEVFFFEKNVHVMSDEQEGWCDTLYFFRNTSDINMLGNAQVTDTTRNVFGLAGRIEYIDSVSRVTMTREPAVISQTKNKDESIDTVYLGAEKLVYYTVPRCDVDSLLALDASKRVESMHVDPVGEYRKKAAAEAAKAAEEAAKNDPNYRPKQGKGKPDPKSARKPKQAESPRQTQLHTDSLSVSDSLGGMNASDSLAVKDTVVIEPPKDTTKIGFLQAVRGVKVYKKDMQIVCDSLLYSDLDSLARFFKEPVIWQEARKQYNADSIYVQVRDGGMDKASLMANAFITIQEDATHFDQIKGTEMLAYFDSEGELSRFDVLGGASALFYIEENDAFATVNKPESKMLSAIFADGEIQRIYYYDQAKNDGYPVVQLSEEDKLLKGYNWQPEKRPEDRNAVTPLSLRPSQRRMYSARPRAKYSQTDIYFPGYMGDVYKQIAVRDSLRRIRERDRKIAEQRAKEQAKADSLALADMPAAVDSIAPAADSIPQADTLAGKVPSLPSADSLAVAADTVAARVLTPAEIKAAEKAAAKAAKAKRKAEKAAEREARKKRRQEALEAKWAEKDRRDAEKAAAKEAKRRAKERKRKRKALEDAAERARKEAELLEEYLQEFREEKRRASEK